MPTAVQAQAETSTKLDEEPSQASASLDNDLAARMAALEEKASRADILEAQVADLDARLEAMEFAAVDKELSGASQKLHIYGFFDSTFAGHVLQGKDNSLQHLAIENFSFTMLNLNVYLAAQFTQSLRSLVELRFGFLPHGAKTYTSRQGMPEFQRIDTSMRNRTTGEITQYGSVGIERAHLTWQPMDQLGFTVGRFFTPFGIWNIDHGSPVVLPIFLPYLQLRQAMPLAQSGLMAHGRLYLKRVYFDYAITVSNGRGPADAVYDIDQNKAVGAKLKVSYSSDNVNVALGGYGYYGTSKNELETVAMEPKLLVTATAIEKSREAIGAVDFLLEVHGLRLQAEGLLKQRLYDVPPLQVVPIADAVLPAALGYQASHIQSDIYALLAYTLPMAPWFGDVLVTPYALFEYSVQDDNRSEYDVWDIRAGLNVRFTPNIVGKVEYLHLQTPDRTLISGPDHMIGAQVAVAF
jgi:hypothetical protein